MLVLKFSSHTLAQIQTLTNLYPWNCAEIVIYVTKAQSAVTGQIQSQRSGDISRNVATTNWRIRQTFGGLSHLEGQTVNTLSDASAEPQKTVTGGSVTLESPKRSGAHRSPITAEFRNTDIINAQKRCWIKSRSFYVNDGGQTQAEAYGQQPGGTFGMNIRSGNLEFHDDPVDDATGKKPAANPTATGIKTDAHKIANGSRPSVLAVIPRLPLEASDD